MPTECLSEMKSEKQEGCNLFLLYYLEKKYTLNISSIDHLQRLWMYIGCSGYSVVQAEKKQKKELFNVKPVCRYFSEVLSVFKIGLVVESGKLQGYLKTLLKKIRVPHDILKFFLGQYGIFIIAQIYYAFIA